MSFVGVALKGTDDNMLKFLSDPHDLEQIADGCTNHT